MRLFIDDSILLILFIIINLLGFGGYGLIGT